MTPGRKTGMYRAIPGSMRPAQDEKLAIMRRRSRPIVSPRPRTSHHRQAPGHSTVLTTTQTSTAAPDLTPGANRRNRRPARNHPARNLTRNRRNRPRVVLVTF